MLESTELHKWNMHDICCIYADINMGKEWHITKLIVI